MTTDSLLSIAVISAELRPDNLTEQPGAQSVPVVASLQSQGPPTTTAPIRPWLGTDFAYTVVAR